MIICGDCVEVMAGMPENHFDAIVTDPPYFLPAKHYATRKTFRRNFADLGILESFFRSAFWQFERILKQTGTMYIFCDGQSYPLFYRLGYPFTKTIRPLIWDKKVSINGYSWRHQYEIIIFSEMPEAPCIKTGDGDILRFSAVPVDSRKHPAEKPLELLRVLIKKSVPSNGLILDPFAGSGTTGMVAKEEGFRFIGIDKELEYCKIAEKRIAATQGISYPRTAQAALPMKFEEAIGLT